MLAWMALFISGLISSQTAIIPSELTQGNSGLISMTKIAEKVIDFEFHNKFNHYNKD